MNSPLFPFQASFIFTSVVLCSRKNTFTEEHGLTGDSIRFSWYPRYSG
uniref:Uncharacterized protein n=1 Tax=Arundo donax TaxID=35708 RepID=A0A0A9C356_ARUDO